jgi:hypothetical protein
VRGMDGQLFRMNLVYSDMHMHMDFRGITQRLMFDCVM